MTTLDAAKSFFIQHGTKSIGWLTQILGVLAAADPQLIGAMFGSRGVGVIMLMLGIATTLRGHANTARIKDGIRVEEVAKEEIKVEQAIEQLKDGGEIGGGGT